ncbi:MAG: RelA/SpoT family protein [Betaproteobacteria bacterium]
MSNQGLVERAKNIFADEVQNCSVERSALLSERVKGVAETLQQLMLDQEVIAASYCLDLDQSNIEGMLDGSDEFSQVLPLVNGFHRLEPIQHLRRRAGDNRKGADQLESVRKMFLAMGQDIRIVLLKLAHQLELLREQTRIDDAARRVELAHETFELFSPLANRLGIWQIKWEMEDLAFRFTDPDSYKKVAKFLDEKRPIREKYLDQFVTSLRVSLGDGGISSEVTGRPKHIYSIWRKLRMKGAYFEQLSDIRAVRVIVDKVSDCYSALGIVHARWSPVPGEFDDYIAKPKNNDYQSLHTAIVGPDQKIIEVQIRTKAMHEHAELGVAAHWRYKEGASKDKAFDSKVAWLRQVLDWKDEISSLGQIKENFKDELSEATIYCLTPQGRVVDLPGGSTAIDFAYALHTELGHRCRGAKINGKLRPLDTALKNGDLLEIVTSKDGGPSRDWINPELGFIRSSRARSKIRSWFSAQDRDESISHGRTELDRLLHKMGSDAPTIARIVEGLNFSSSDDLFLQVHRGDVTLSDLRSLVRDESPDKNFVPAMSSAKPAVGPEVLVVGVDQLLTRVARCCKPIPYEAILGYVSRGRGVMVHRANCPNLETLKTERIVDVAWPKVLGRISYEADLEIFSEGNKADTRRVLDALGHEKIRIVQYSSSVGSKRLVSKVTIEVDSLEFLDRAIKVISALEGVLSVRRL